MSVGEVPQPVDLADAIGPAAEHHLVGPEIAVGVDRLPDPGLGRDHFLGAELGEGRREP